MDYWKYTQNIFGKWRWTKTKSNLLSIGVYGDLYAKNFANGCDCVNSAWIGSDVASNARYNVCDLNVKKNVPNLGVNGDVTHKINPN